MSYQLGIDLGTTWTAAAVSRDGHAAMATLGVRTDAVPSVVLIHEDGTVLVGEAAERRALSMPERVAREFKRRVGDTTPILIGGSPFSAEAVTARLLRWVVDEVTGREGGPPDAVVISHPANWGAYKIELLVQAIQLAGLAKAHLMTEPEAAAIHYARQERVETGSVIAIYDLGGGTFDAAVLRKSETGFEVLGTPKGIERLGGIDFDAAVFGHVSRSLLGELDHLDEDDPETQTAMARLRADCVAAKEALSLDTDTTIPVLLPDIRTEIRLTRAEFEAMIRPSLLDSIGALRLAISSAGIEASDLSAVLLVGGSSRIPMVAQLVGAALDRPVNVDAHPKNSIALGAAAHGATAGGEHPESAAPLPVPPPPPPEPPASATPPPPATEPPAIPQPPATAPPSVPAPGAPTPEAERPVRTWWKIALPVGVVIAVVAVAIGLLAGSDGTEETSPAVGSAGEADTDPAPTTPGPEPETEESASEEPTDEEPAPEEPTAQEPEAEDRRLLVDRGTVTLDGPGGAVSAFVAEPAGEQFGVRLEGLTTVTITFDTGGGSTSGTITGSMSGTSIDLGNEYSVSYTGTLSGTYEPEDGQFEGTIVWSGTATPGVESALPADTTWDGAVLPAGFDCGDIPGPCIFGATRPDIDGIWNLALAADSVNPNRDTTESG